MIYPAKSYNFLLFRVHFFNNFLIKSFSLDSSDLISQLLSERVVPNWNSLLRSMRSQNPVSSRFHALRHQKSNFYFWNKFFSSSTFFLWHQWCWCNAAIYSRAVDRRVMVLWKARSKWIQYWSTLLLKKPSREVSFKVN